MSKTSDAKAVKLKVELETTNDALDEANETIERLEAALVEIKYWLHDGLFYGKPVTSPRRILANVERALNP